MQGEECEASIHFDFVLTLSTGKGLLQSDTSCFCDCDCACVSAICMYISATIQQEVILPLLCCFCCCCSSNVLLSPSLFTLQFIVQHL